MGLIAYNGGIPNPPNNPSNDVPLMKINTDAIAQYVAVDHIAFNTNNSGYHTLVHQQIQGIWNAVARTGSPAPTANFNQIYTLNYLPDYTGAGTNSQLFSGSDGGGVFQLTGLNAQSDGWAWSGGILIQWGRVTTASSGSFPGGSASGSVTFKDRNAGPNIPFPSSCFIVIGTPIWSTASGSPNGAASVDINQTTLSNTKFDWKFNSNSANYIGFHWIAIGI